MHDQIGPAVTIDVLERSLGLAVRFTFTAAPARGSIVVASKVAELKIATGTLPLEASLMLFGDDPGPDQRIAGGRPH